MRFIALLYIAISLTSFASISVTDGRGKAVSLPAYPKRIVSLTPSNTEILFALGLGDKIIGVTGYCDYPSDAKAIPDKVGDMAISVEKVISLKPDLVVAHSLLNANAISALERLNIPVYADDPKNIRQVIESTHRLARLCGAMKAGRKLTQSMNTAIMATLNETCKNPIRPRVMLAVQQDPLWIAGKDTFADEIIRIAGGVNIGDETSKFYQTSVETVIAENPAIILCAHPKTDTYESNSIWTRVSAVKNKQIHYVNADIYSRAGPRLIEALFQAKDLIKQSKFAE